MGWSIYDANGILKTRISGQLLSDSAIINSNRLIGRYSAGLGTFEELLIGSGLYLSGSGLYASTTSSASSISDFNESVDDRVDSLITVNPGLVKVYDDPGNSMNLYLSSAHFQARLTLTTGVANPTGNVTAATEIFLTQFNGGLITLYDGTRSRDYYLSSDISIKITDTQTGTTTSGNKIISGLTDTSKLVVGMKVSGTGVGAAAVISTIDSATQVTVSVNSSGSGTNSITFKCPANTLYDIFVYVSSGALKLELAAWTSLTARSPAVTLALQDGYLVKSGTPTRRFVGCVLTTATDGQTERTHGADVAGSTTTTGGRCYVANYYNRMPFYIEFIDTTPHNYTTSVYRNWNNSSNAFCGFISCNADFDLQQNIQAYLATGASAVIAAGFGLNWAGSGLTSDSLLFFSIVSSLLVVGTVRQVKPRLGFNFGQVYEYGSAGCTQQQVFAGYVVPA